MPDVRHGRLVALRTKGEVGSSVELGEVYAINVPAKCIFQLTKAVDDALDGSDRHCLSHLRRVAKSAQLPFIPGVSKSAGEHEQHQQLPAGPTLKSERRSGSPDGEIPKPDKGVDDPDGMHLILCRKTIRTSVIIHARLVELDLDREVKLSQRLYVVNVPLLAPSSAEQASHWTELYWPTVYKKTNPYGPQHNVVTNAAEEVYDGVDRYMRLAHEVAKEASGAKIGRPVGAVAVQRTGQNRSSVVAAVGDARWCSVTEETISVDGNPMAHCVLRAIGLIARGRLGDGRQSSESTPRVGQRPGFADFPLNSLEERLYAPSTLDERGYLCLNLELYLTHEPCVMCSMAILHSRFARVVFETRMPRTGSLSAEGDKAVPGSGLGYGLFWQGSLNWKFLAWQWIAHIDAMACVDDAQWHA